MTLISEKGDFTLVPSNFLIGIWCPCDGAITHGDPYHLVVAHMDIFRKAKKLYKDKGDNLLGTVERHICERVEKDGVNRRVLLLYNHLAHHIYPTIPDTRSCIQSMWKLLEPMKVRKISLHVPLLLPIGSFLSLLDEELHETDLQIVVRTW